MYIHVLMMIIYLFKIFHMSIKVFPSLTVKDYEQLQELAGYLLSLKFQQIDVYSLPITSVAFSPADMALLKKLKHLHVLYYDKK